jgi:hypothetical protein
LKYLCLFSTHYLSSPEGCFYGNDVGGGSFGFVSHDGNSAEICVAADSWGPALRIFFNNNKVTNYMIFLPE